MQEIFGGGSGCGCGGDAFVAKLDGDLGAQLQATYLGGTDSDFGNALVVHPTTGNVYVAGGTYSGDFPVTAGAAQTDFGGVEDVWVARLNGNLTPTDFKATFLGGSAPEEAFGLALHPSTGELYVTGGTVSLALTPWIEQFFHEGITRGCSTNPPLYCPSAAVTRGEIAVLLLRAKHGAGYQPPPAAGLFTDVPVNHPLAAFIEQLSNEGITKGCGPTTFCPDGVVTRGQIAVFLARTFNLGSDFDF